MVGLHVSGTSQHVSGTSQPATTGQKLSPIATLRTGLTRESWRDDLNNAIKVLAGQGATPFKPQEVVVRGKQEPHRRDATPPSAEIKRDGSLVVTLPGTAADPEKYARGVKVGLVSVDQKGERKVVYATERDGDKIIFPRPPRGSHYDQQSTLVFYREGSIPEVVQKLVGKYTPDFVKYLTPRLPGMTEITHLPLSVALDNGQTPRP